MEATLIEYLKDEDLAENGPPSLRTIKEGYHSYLFVGIHFDILSDVVTDCHFAECIVLFIIQLSNSLSIKIMSIDLNGMSTCPGIFSRIVYIVHLCLHLLFICF